MAANYEIVSAAPVTILNDSGEALERIELYMRTKPSRVVLPLRIYPQLYNPFYVDHWCTRIATGVEAIAQLSGVLAMMHAQSVGRTGTLEDQMWIYVASDSGSSDAPLIYPLTAFVPYILVSGGGTGGRLATGAPVQEPPVVEGDLPTPIDPGPIADDIAAAVRNLNAVEAL